MWLFCLEGRSVSLPVKTAGVVLVLILVLFTRQGHRSSPVETTWFLSPRAQSLQKQAAT